jgi:preprotein translocase subunit SecG
MGTCKKRESLENTMDIIISIILLIFAFYSIRGQWIYSQKEKKLIAKDYCYSHEWKKCEKCGLPIRSQWKLCDNCFAKVKTIANPLKKLSAKQIIFILIFILIYLLLQFSNKKTTQDYISDKSSALLAFNFADQAITKRIGKVEFLDKNIDKSWSKDEYTIIITLGNNAMKYRQAKCVVRYYEGRYELSSLQFE